MVGASIQAGIGKTDLLLQRGSQSLSHTIIQGGDGCVCLELFSHLGGGEVRRRNRQIAGRIKGEHHLSKVGGAGTRLLDDRIADFGAFGAVAMPIDNRVNSCHLLRDFMAGGLAGPVDSHMHDADDCICFLRL